VWHGDRCVAAVDGVNCTACERHCPVKAIKRVKSEGGVLLPVVDAEACIGCGACEHVCPARPMPGMTVAAYERHRIG
jgi:formate hydrogenlyase subunit 6/NADH:ubiquinone oxidoreductase subunit I